MKLFHLRKVRIAVSTIFFILTSLLFLELSGWYAISLSDSILFLQFIPSILSFIKIIGFAAIGFIIILVLTILFGRIYCSSVCPLGYLVDIINFFKKKFHKKRTRKKLRYKFQTPFNKTRYSLLILTVLLFIFGNSLGIVLLDPYSNFGRIITNFFRPLVVVGNNLIVHILEYFDNYSMAPYKFPNIQISVIAIPIIFLGTIFWLSWKYGRLYCNTICPVGSLLGFISNYSTYKIKVDDINCVECGVCETACKANCIDSDNKAIDYSRCIACYDCFPACPTEAIVFTQPDFNIAPVKNVKNDAGRRNFFVTIGLMTAGLVNSIKAKAQDEILVYTKNTLPENRGFPVTPPGSESIEHFITNCTACTLCVSACPTNVLQPSLFEYGIEGLLMPHMDNKSGFCNYECKICSDVCPNEAILPIEIENKKLVQIGKVFFEKDNCIVITQKTECGACAEHCPTKAVKMVLDPELNLRVPETEDKICVGCGACEYACPTIPFKAIYVKGNEVHLLAEKPKEEELKEKVDLEEDFPF